jgi:L-fucose isomerase-like protein
MMEMINERRELIDREETNKMLEAIHDQAKWNRLEEDDKAMMKKINKELKKPTKKSKIKEVLISGIADTLLLTISLAGITAWAFVLMFLCK